MSGTLGNGKRIRAVLPPPPEGKYTRGSCVAPPGVPARHTASGARSIQRWPWPAPVQRLGERLCPHPQNHGPQPSLYRHPAPCHTAAGLLNCLPASERNFSFLLGQEPKQFCSCVSWRSSNPTTITFLREQSTVTMSVET